MALTRSGDAVEVLLDGESVTYLVPMEVVRSSGGSRLDYARFLYNLEETGERVKDMRTPVAFDKTVEILVNGTAVFRGRLHRQDLDVATGENVIVTSSILPQDFGPQVDGMKVFDKRSDAYVTIPGDIVFNPMIDGIIEGNMSTLSDDPEDMQVWCDPESVRTSRAETYRDELASEWVLTDALHSFTRLTMPGEFAEHIEPPDVLGSADIDDDAIPVQNLRIPFGSPVTHGLDLLTHAFGYDWYVKPDVATNKLFVYRRGAGPEKSLTMQAIGSTLDISDDPGATNCHGFRLSVDIGGRVNKLRLVGSREQYELGIDLYRGWATADDTLSLSDLNADDKDSQYKDKPDVWRLFVANEAGDYSGLRDSGVATIPAEPRDLSVNGVLYDHRRFAEDCLTKGPDGQRLPPFFEWSNDAGTTWFPVPRRWNGSMLESQLGIRFHGAMPPEELYAAGDDARLRMTCTITGDKCLEAKAAVEGRDVESDEPGDVWQTIDVSDRYHYRQVEILGDFASHVWESGDDKDERDDTEAIQKAAEYLLKEVDLADIDGDLRLIGLRTDYEIGDLLTSIEGRNIDLNRRASDPGEVESGEPRYLQVMGVRWLFGDVQQTHLATRPQHVDPWYQPGARPDGVV